MKNLSQYKHWYLVTVSILVTALDSVPKLAIYFSGRPFRPMLYGHEGNFYFTFVVLIVDTLLSSLLFSYLNYYWRGNSFIPLKNRFKRAFVLILLNILFITLFVTAKVYFYHLMFSAALVHKILLSFLVKTFMICMISFVSGYILFLIIKSKIIEIENLKLRRENIEAQFKTLKDQLNPHFLFNTLNSLSSVIRLSDKQESLTFVDKMSEVYRYILESNEYKLISIERELNFLNAYLFLLQKRFGSNLEIEINIDEFVKSFFIPPMTLQILVENAVKHNKVISISHLKISIYNLGDYLIITNNLQKKLSKEGYGIGLGNLRNRYKLISDGEIIITEADNNFTVKLPIIKDEGINY
jgi:hypothetical protein